MKTPMRLSQQDKQYWLWKEQDCKADLVNLADYGIPAGQAIAGDQILLGFDGGKLVYVQTFELAAGAGS